MRYFLLFLVLVRITHLSGQDIQYSQYYANPLYLNPAFSGAIPDHRASVNHRIQWPALPRAFTNYSASYDYNAANLNSGFGILFNADRAGSANLRNTSAAFNYSYTVDFERRFILKPAVSFGFVNRSIDYDKLLFGDQIDFGVDGAPSRDPSIAQIETTTYIDLGAGLLAYNKNLWAGISAFHINEPNNSIIDGQNYLPRKLSVHAGARFDLGNSVFTDNKKVSMAPSFIYKEQGEFRQLDIGTSFHYTPVILGLWYRGLPFLKSDVPNTINHDAIILLFGLEFNDFEFGYSYDTNISELTTDTGGVHEFSLQYYFQLASNRKNVARSKKFLPCPAFIKRRALQH